jgi:2TM domain
MQTQPTFASPPAQTPAGTGSMDPQRERAIKRIKKKNAFGIHLLVYLTVNAMLVVVWAALVLGGWSHYFRITLLGPGSTLPSDFFWPIFPIVGWGIGLALHANAAYRGDTYTEEQIQREMKKL